MESKRFNGKAIYEPTGKAAEYSPWACNFFTGCSNDCDYCYCKRGVMSHVWDNKPHLKKCFNSEQHAFAVFCKELDKCEDIISEVGLLFSFTTDPLLPETRDLTFMAMEEAISRGINVKVLTKRADWVEEFMHRTAICNILYGQRKDGIAFGFTLTGFDEREPGASTTAERIRAMVTLHTLGYKTFASIEPIIDPVASLNIIKATKEVCDLYKVGTMSGRKIDYKWVDMRRLFDELVAMSREGKNIYLKDSFINHFGMKREDCPGKFVRADYNLFGAKK